MIKKYDLAIAYRIYPGISPEAPAIFENNKTNMVQVCLPAFKQALTGVRAKIWALLDNCPDEYVAYFKDLWPESDLVIERLPGLGNQKTFQRQIEILSNQTDADIVLFAEDDYLFLPNQIATLLAFMRGHADVDFLSPCDHLDYHTLPQHRHSQRIRMFAEKRWKTAVATTCTFFARKEVLVVTAPVFLTYYKKFLFNKMTDLGVWLSLTKHHVFNPWKLLKYTFTRPFWGWGIFCAWWVEWRQILFGPKYHLWAPEPSSSTHLVQNVLAPGTDWDKEIAQRLPPKAK